jgi:hypothetical protein
MTDTNDTHDTEGAIVRLPTPRGRAAHNGSKVMASALLTQIRSASKATRTGMQCTDPASRYECDGTLNRTVLRLDVVQFLHDVRRRSDARSDGAPLPPWSDRFKDADRRLATRCALWGATVRRDFANGSYDVTVSETTTIPVPDDLADVAVKVRPNPAGLIDTIARHDAQAALATYGSAWFGSSVRSGRTGFRTHAPTVADDSAL